MRGFLLDTHVFFWALTDSVHLRAGHRHLLATTTEPLYVSAVTCLEIALKVRLGKWVEAATLLPDIATKLNDYSLLPLPITLQQAELAGSLHAAHRDPFDRLLAAQAIDLDLTVMTVDTAFPNLGCRVA